MKNKDEKMRPDELPPPAQLMKFIVGRWISKPIYAAAELGLADILIDGPKCSKELARASQTHAPTLYRMMRALASVGILTTVASWFSVYPSMGLGVCGLKSWEKLKATYSRLANHFFMASECLLEFH